MFWCRDTPHSERPIGFTPAKGVNIRVAHGVKTSVA